MGETVAGPVRRFIAAHIVSVVQLEVLLLLRAAADKEWTVDEVARALVTHGEAAAGWLDDLTEHGLVRKEAGRYRYAPSTPEDDRTIDDLAESYARYRVAVISLIFARPSERITRFADAFRFRRRD